MLRIGRPMFLLNTKSPWTLSLAWLIGATGIDGGKVGHAHGRRGFKIPVNGEILDFGVTEADIANADPRVVF